MIFKKLSDIETKGATKVLRTDIATLNKAGYLRDGEGDLTFLGGRPGNGKTLLGFQIAHHVALSGPVLFFSLEMTSEQLKARSVKAPKSKDAELYICDQPGLTASEISGLVEEFMEESPLKLVVIDYAQIIQSSGRTKAEEVGEVVTTLKSMAKRTGVSMLLLAQLSRDIEKRSTADEFAEPVLSDFADSASIEKWADCCLMIHRVPKKDRVFRVSCVKFRHGEMGAPFELTLNAQSLTFDDGVRVLYKY